MKGISSILGTLIFLQILLIALLIVIHIQDGETQVTINTIQRLQSLSEDSPITEFVQNGIAYIYSPHPLTITHIIYPNGYIDNTTIMLTKMPVAEVLKGYPWAIIVTSEGNWFNISKIGNDSLSNFIVFPDYHDYGTPITGAVKNISSDPNWNYLDGIYGPAGYALVPLNVSIDGQTFNYGVTGVEIVVNPNQPKGWINMTFYAPINTINSHVYNTHLVFGVYVPTNITWIAYPAIKNYGTSFSGYTIEYLYTYVSFTDCVVDNFTYYYYTLGSVYPPSNPSNNPWYWGPLINYFPAQVIKGPYILYPDVPSNPPEPPHFYFNILYYTNPIEIYQFDINIYNGEWLLYGYSEFYHKWQLLYNYTYGYTNYTYINWIVEPIKNTSLATAYNVNATSMIYPTNYPLYIVVPQNVYLLQVVQ